MLVLRVGMPWIVTGVLTFAICTGWNFVLDEWPETGPTLILTFGIGVVVGFNWPRRWLP